MISEKLIPILECRTIHEMGFVQLNTDTYNSVSSVQTQPKSQNDYCKEFPEVFHRYTGELRQPPDKERRGAHDLTSKANLPVPLRQPVKEELRRLQELDVMTTVTSHIDWVSQLVTVHKSDGTVRLCIDPRPLNEALRRDRYHLPTFTELLPEPSDASFQQNGFTCWLLACST